MSTARESSAVDADAEVLAPAADDSGFDAFYAQNYAPLLRVIVGFTRR